MIYLGNMRFKFFYPVLLLGLMTMCSCKSSKSNIDNNEVFAVVSDQYIDMELTYVGATFDYHIMECYIVNKYDRDITLDRFNFELINEKRNVGERPYSPNEALTLLDTQQERLKKQKRASLVTGILTTGFNVAANAALGGSAVNSVAYGIESAIYIADDSRFYNRNIKSIEDEKIYINDYVLETMIIPAGDKVTADVIFPIHNMRGDVQILFVGPDNDYMFEFNASDFASR